MAVKNHWPELGDPKPQAQIEASRCHFGKHWFVSTPLELKGRGIKFLDTYTVDNLVKTPIAQRKVGWHRYQVTLLAFAQLKEKYDISVECLLD